MKNKLFKILAGMLAGVLLGTSIPVQNIYASDVKKEQSVNVSDETNLNYFYVESPYLETPNQQNIVVSLGDGTENIENVTLQWKRKDGSIEVWENPVQQDELFLFSKEFKNENSDVYEIALISFEENNNKKELQLAELGIEAQFGVNEEYEGYEAIPAESVELETSVITLDEEEGSVEENVSEALDEVDVNAKKRTTDDGKLVVALDPGHDSTHAGAQGNGVQEEVATLKIAQACKTELEEYSDVVIHMTRTTGECPNPGLNSIDDIKKRVETAAANGADVFVSFHLNSSTSSSANGAEVYYPNNNYNPEVGESGAALAQDIQNELVGLGLTNRGIKINNSDSATYPDGSAKDAYAVINSAKTWGIPGLIIEHAFLSNSSDASKYLTDAGLKKLGVADANGIAKHYGLKKGDWEYFEGKGWKYKKNGKYLAEQWAQINGKWYYFGKDEYMVTGWLTINGQTSYLDKSGAAVTGWQTIDGNRYYFFSNTYMAKGKQVIDGKTYYFDPTTGILQETHKPGWSLQNGKWYYYNSDGLKTVGWSLIAKKWYYFNENGVMQTGWQLINEKWYYFNGSGAMLTGWQQINSKWYYFTGSGAMQIGWLQLNSKWYYFNENGAMQTAWYMANGKWYYSNGSGVMQTGWLKLNNKWYYLNGSGAMQTGWQTIGSQRYYFVESGVMQTGWQLIDSKWYYFNGSGAMQKGWLSLNGSWYYLDKNGVMQTGWQTIDGKDYYFTSSGVMQNKKKTGWIYENDNWYYYDASCKKTTGWQCINDKWYYLDKDGVMQTGWLTIDGHTYYLSSNGAAVTGWQTIDEKVYYFDSNRQMLTGKHVIDGEEYYFDENGVLGEEPKEPEQPEEPENPEEELYLIENASSVTVEQMVAYFEQSGKTYPAESLEKGGAPDIETFCKLYEEEANAEGIAVEVAFAQSMKETGWLQFGGSVKVEQFNFAGLGAVDGSTQGADFSSYGEEGVRMGIRAQIQHLKAYASETITEETLKNPCVDPRFKYVKKGSAKYVEWLGQKENPTGAGWATSENYGIDIVKMINKLKGN